MVYSAYLSSVQFSHSVVSDSLQPYESQHARPPCPSPTPRGHTNSCPSSPWCHPAISSSVIPFSSCPQSLPASESFPVLFQLSYQGSLILGRALLFFQSKGSISHSDITFPIIHFYLLSRILKFGYLICTEAAQQHVYFNWPLAIFPQAFIHW